MILKTDTTKKISKVWECIQTMIIKLGCWVQTININFKNTSNITANAFMHTDACYLNILKWILFLKIGFEEYYFYITII